MQKLSNKHLWARAAALSLPLMLAQVGLEKASESVGF
jgi:hypothetical protein